MNYNKFVKKYKPFKNEINPNESYNGFLFETYGTDLTFITSSEFHVRQIWTLISAENEEEYIIPGYHIINREGYFLTEKPWEDGSIEINLNELITVGLAKYTAIDFIEEELGIPLEDFEDRIHEYYSSLF